MCSVTRPIAVLCGLLAVIAIGPVRAADPAKPVDGRPVAKEIDRRLAEHWAARRIVPASEANDATLYRRLAIDLTGRIPAPAEWRPFVEGKGTLDERTTKAVQQLLDGPEFTLHLGAVLDEIIQGSAAGNAEFIDYLRLRLQQRRSWDALFRELVAGPWDSDEAKPAQRFLQVRVKEIDRLTTDTARVFFGVDVSCARCHDHPLVDDWKQDHYYGMSSFFSRTSGGKDAIREKSEGEVVFRAADGTQKTARLMFLSGTVVDEPAGAKPKLGRREQLVAVALEEQRFLSRSFVNRLWQHFFGRGLVSPVDQMHSENPPSVPGLLEWLAEDFVASGYDIHRLAAGITLSRAYRLSSRWESETAAPEAGGFAVSQARLLPRRQYALSLLVATGRAGFSPDASAARVERIAGVRGLKRIEQYLAAEDQAATFQKQLDPGTDGQSSAAEALFVSNGAAVQDLVRAAPNTFAASLAAIESPRSIVEAAIRQVFSRPPSEGEADRLAAWLAAQGGDRPRACEQLLWALVTSAEFRFNH